MFQSLRQQRTVSSAQETPRAVPSIKLTTATPVASASTMTSTLAPRRDDYTPRRVVPKRSLALHEAPPPLPLPKPRVLPVRDHSAGPRPASRTANGFGSTNGKIKVFIDPPNDEAVPQLVQKKKSRAALDSIKWALGDRTNGPKDKDTTNKPEKPKVSRSSIDSDREKSDKEKWKWTLGRSRKEKLGRNSPAPGSQPASVRMQSPPVSSISSAHTLMRSTSPLPVSSRAPTPVPENDADEPKTGSIAIRAMRSVRSMARIGGWSRSDSPTATMGKRLAKSSTMAKEPSGATGSGESWLVGSLSSAGSPPRDATVSLGTGRPQPERRSSVEKPLPSIRFGSIMPGRKSRLSTSTASSGESVLPRESTSTRAPSIDSKRTSTSSRRSSGVGSVMSSSFWMPSSSIPEGDSSDQASPSTKRDSKSTDGLRRSALANVFDISSSSNSSETPSSIRTRDSGSTESYGTLTKRPVPPQKVGEMDPFAAGDVDSYLPATVRGASAPPETIPALENESFLTEIRPRPVSDQGIRTSLFDLFGEKRDANGENTGGLTMVNAATSELSDLIHRLDLTATPEASPARGWLQATPNRSPDAMPEFAIATVERAIRQRYPDVPSSVHSKGNTTFNADSSFSSEATPQPVPPRGISNMPLSGSVADLRKGTSTGPGPFLSNSIRLESSITSLRPYRLANRLPAIHLSPSSEPESMAPTDTESPMKRRTVRRPRPAQRPRERSSEESLHAKLQALSPEVRRSLGMGGLLADSNENYESSSSSDREDPTSESADDEQSDIPDELQMIMRHQGDDTMSSLRSLEDSLSASSRPTSQASEQSYEPMSAAHAHPFSITVTAPSLSSQDSDLESPVDDEGEHEDDTGKKSFDFTGEINRLNEGGARISFVEQLEAAFNLPDDLQSPSLKDFGGSQDGSPTALQWDLSNAGSNSTLRKPSPGYLDTDFKFGTPSSEQNDTLRARSMASKHSRTNTETSVLSEHELSLLKDLDASMYALATLNLVHPSSQTTLTDRKPVTAGLAVPKSVPPTADISLEDDVDSSAYKIATIDLSLIYPSGVALPQTPAVSDESASAEYSISDSAIEISRGRTLSMESDTSSKRRTRSTSGHATLSVGHSRQESEQSTSSFGSILYAGVSDPFGYKYDEVSELPSLAESSKPSVRHGHSDSLASIPSISSYGQIIKGGTGNPFGYAASFRTTHTREISADFDYSQSGYPDESVEPRSRDSIRKHRAHKSTDSDRSTFYFRGKEPPPPLPLPPLPENYRVHQRDESSASIAPPVSLHNVSYRRHQRNRSSNDSGSSIAHAYSNFGANGGRATWARHQSDASVDSLGSDFSAPAVDRPGLGDKMFSSAAAYRNGAPLTSILASPSASEEESFPENDRFSTFDAVSSKRSSGDSDAFLKPGHASDISVFGAEEQKPSASRGLLFGHHVGNQRRPLSVFSSASVSTNDREDDTMISMLGGGHVSRKAIGETFSSSPCFKSKPRKKRPAFQVKVDRSSADISSVLDELSSSEEHSFPLAVKPSTTFGTKRMALAAQGLLERTSLEEAALSAEGSDVSAIASSSKPIAPRLARNIFAESLNGKADELPASSKRAAPIILTPAPDTPPTSDAESMYSQSNIDVTRLSVSEFSRPSSASSVRIRARGYGHRRRSVSPSVDVSTILEEVPGLVRHSFSSSGSSVSSIASTVPSTRFDLLNGMETHVDIVEVEDDTHDEMMQRYLTLRKQALDVIQQSKTDWQDTDFSRFAVATFIPPTDSKAIQAFYDHSLKTYTHLPMELCIRRPRTNSRPTPYGNRTPKKTPGRRVPKPHSRTESMEQALASISPPALAALPPNSPFAIDRSFSSFGLPPPVPAPGSKLAVTENNFKAPSRPRVNSKVRRNALGWSKQRVVGDDGKPELPAPFSSMTARGKENSEATGMLNSPNTSLRISRPRPKARPQSMLSSVKAR